MLPIFVFYMCVLVVENRTRLCPEQLTSFTVSTIFPSILAYLLAILASGLDAALKVHDILHLVHDNVTEAYVEPFFYLNTHLLPRQPIFYKPDPNSICLSPLVPFSLSFFSQLYFIEIHSLQIPCQNGRTDSRKPALTLSQSLTLLTVKGPIRNPNSAIAIFDQWKIYLPEATLSASLPTDRQRVILGWKKYVYIECPRRYEYIMRLI